MNVIVAANNLMAILYSDVGTVDGVGEMGEEDEMCDRMGGEIGSPSGTLEKKGVEMELELRSMHDNDEESQEAAIPVAAGGSRGSNGKSKKSSNSSSSHGSSSNGSSSNGSASSNNGRYGTGSSHTGSRASPLSNALDSKRVRGLWRIAIMVPSLALSAIWWTLDEILAWTGVIGMLLAFVVPTGLYPLSRAAAAEAFGPSAAACGPFFLPHWLVAGTLQAPKADKSITLALESALEPERPAPSQQDVQEGRQQGEDFGEESRCFIVRGVLVFGIAMALLALAGTIAIDSHFDTTGWWR